MSYLLADGDYYYDGGVIVGGSAYGSGGPPITKAKYTAYYKRHKLGPITDAAIEKAFQKRLMGEWVAVGKRASKHGKHRAVRKTKKAATKKKVTKKESLATKKKAFFKKLRDENNGSRAGSLAKWRIKHPEDKPKKRTTKK